MKYCKNCGIGLCDRCGEHIIEGLIHIDKLICNQCLTVRDIDKLKGVLYEKQTKSA
jgi:formylmethanofuran dehydrogenase subunit E